MDHSNYADMTSQAPTVEAQRHVRMFREFDPEANSGDEEVPDPWYGGNEGFSNVLTMIERTADGLVASLPDLLAN